MTSPSPLPSSSAPTTSQPIWNFFDKKPQGSNLGAPTPPRSHNRSTGSLPYSQQPPSPSDVSPQPPRALIYGLGLQQSRIPKNQRLAGLWSHENLSIPKPPARAPNSLRDPSPTAAFGVIATVEQLELPAHCPQIVYEHSVERPPSRPMILPPPTLGVVPLLASAHARQGHWERFSALMGDLCYLGAYPGDKRRENCAAWARELRLGPPDGSGCKDVSEMRGSKQVTWLISPTVVRSENSKLRYAVNRQGEWRAALETPSTEWTLHAMRQLLAQRHSRAMTNDDIDKLERQIRRATSLVHVAHSLAMGATYGEKKVFDLINCHGKVLGIVPLYNAVSPARLCCLPAPLRRTFARRYALPLAKMLRDMHADEAVHFNVTLDNLLLTSKGCSLSGFASAHFIGELGLPSERTPSHEPPEMVLMERQYDCSLDIWGLGMTLMRLLCGKKAFLVAAERPHDQGLPKETWDQYAHWHATKLLTLRGPAPGGRLSPSRPHGSKPLAEQLDRGVEEAMSVDAELTRFVLRHMLTPSARERMMGDTLVSAAALMSQALKPAEQTALDKALFEGPGAAASPVRADMLARMGQLLPVWRDAPKVTLPVGRSFRRPSIV